VRLLAFALSIGADSANLMDGINHFRNTIGGPSPPSLGFAKFTID
jgi:hypothetical protein